MALFPLAALSKGTTKNKGVIRMTVLRNLTPHPVVVIGMEGKVIMDIPSEGGVLPRASEKRGVLSPLSVEGNVITINEVSMGDVENLPPQEDGVKLIVSRIVASACPEREDLFVPDETVRDEQGRIVGCRALARI